MRQDKEQAMDNNRWNLSNKKALITGGTKGIGRAIAEEFLQLGAEIFIVSRNETHLNQLLDEWKASNYKVHGFVSDFNNGNACLNIINEVQKIWDHIDILVNNAGTNIRKSAQTYTVSEYAEIMR